MNYSLKDTPKNTRQVTSSNRPRLLLQQQQRQPSHGDFSRQHGNVKEKNAIVRLVFVKQITARFNDRESKQ